MCMHRSCWDVHWRRTPSRTVNHRVNAQASEYSLLPSSFRVQPSHQHRCSLTGATTRRTRIKVARQTPAEAGSVAAAEPPAGPRAGAGSVAAAEPPAGLRAGARAERAALRLGRLRCRGAVSVV